MFEKTNISHVVLIFFLLFVIVVVAIFPFISEGWGFNEKLNAHEIQAHTERQRASVLARAANCRMASLTTNRMEADFSCSLIPLSDELKIRSFVHVKLTVFQQS